MKGRYTCNELKKIRKQIADANGIEYHVSECNYQGDCTGTCPKCESELRYIESELANRQRSGKSVVLAGLAAGFTFFNAVSCNPFSADGNYEEPLIQGMPAPYDTTICNPADTTACAPEDNLDNLYLLQGEIAVPENPDEQ